MYYFWKRIKLRNALLAFLISTSTLIVFSVIYVSAWVVRKLPFYVSGDRTMINTEYFWSQEFEWSILGVLALLALSPAAFRLVNRLYCRPV
jgi:hypothetical protein